MTLTRALAEFALMTKTDSVPESALAASRKLTLDSLACALAGWHAPGVADVVDQMRTWGGAPEASLLIHGGHLPAPNAAFANSVMIHALDYDDVHIPGSLHIMSVVLPAALAAGEMAGATGRHRAGRFGRSGGGYRGGRAHRHQGPRPRHPRTRRAPASQLDHRRLWRGGGVGAAAGHARQRVR